MAHYPDRHHPVYFLESALQAIGVNAQFAKDERTLGCWGLIFPDFDNRVMVWLIDNRHPHEAMREDPAAKILLKTFVIVCHAQKPDMLRVGGHWMPLAASPGFRKMDAAKTADCAFIGYIRDEGRARLLSDIRSRYSLALMQGVFGDNAVHAYCSARVGVNVPTGYGGKTDYDSANMRCFEILACGVPLVTSDESYLSELGLIDGETCVTYGAHRDIVEAVAIALQSPHIGTAGLELVNARHTYTHRALQVLEWLKEPYMERAL